MPTLQRLREEWFPTPDAFDRSRGVRTAGIKSLFWRRLVMGKRMLTVRYQPVDPAMFHEAIAAVPRWTFIDMGCGKGRALILAHEHGFGKLIGVDFSPVLCQYARKNLEKLGIQATIVNTDARDFDFPPEACVVFFYNPFGAAILNHVLSKLSRRSKTIFVYVNPAHPEAFQNCELLDKGQNFSVFMSHS
jgi:SAM-dependent methyltransferase